MNIVTRDQWGARPPDYQNETDPTEAWLHHTVGRGVGGAEYMRSMQNFHMDGRGWSDIAYNYVVDPKTLNVFEGRGCRIRPGAQKGHNEGTVAVAVMGDYRTDPVAPELLDTLADLLIYLHVHGCAPKYWTGGHRDAPGQSTTCPGRLADHIDAINERIIMADKDLGPNGEPNWSRVQDQFKPAWSKAWAARVVNEHTDPKDTVSKEELMVFLDRAGLFGGG